MGDEPKAKSLLAVLRGVVDRHVKQRPRDAIIRNATEDPAKPLARRVTERDACDFCDRNATDEPVDPRRVSDRFHQFCKCHLMLFFQETRYRDRLVGDEDLRRGGVDLERGADPDWFERRDALVLAAIGHKVKFLRRLRHSRMADTLVDGERVEFKNPTSSGLFTVQNQILKNLYGSNKEIMRPQSDVLLISNVRNSMTMAEMERSLAFAFGPDSKLTTEEMAYMRKIILLDERTRRVRVYEMKDAGVARLLGPRRRQIDISTNAAGVQDAATARPARAGSEPLDSVHSRRIDEAVVVHENLYSMAAEEVGIERRSFDLELKAKWAEYKAMAKRDGVSPKAAYDSTVGKYFASLSEPGRMSVDSFVDLTNNKGHEVQLAKWFADAGHTVKLRTSSLDGDTNDALIDGVVWEFKRITSKHRNKIVKRVTEHLPRQGPRFVVDLSESPIKRSEAERVIAELLDEDGVDEIMLVMDGRVKHFVK